MGKPNVFDLPVEYVLTRVAHCFDRPLAYSVQRRGTD
jgi:hypothetical protein